MEKAGGNRNFGWGKQVSWAGKQALKAAYGGGRYKTVHSHAERWRSLCHILKSLGIKDARHISNNTLHQIGASLSGSVINGEYSVSYAQNLISTANTVLWAMRGNREVWVSPAQLIGNRTSVRMRPPDGICLKDVRNTANEMREVGLDRAAAVAELCRTLGVRRQEAALMKVREALRQAREHNAVNVTLGTKGGRGIYVDRWVPVNADSRAALAGACDLAGRSRNLVPPNTMVHRFLNSTSKAWAAHTTARGNRHTLRDLRAAYACERYEVLTGAQAPCVAGERLAPKTIDRQARLTLAQELGHNRLDVIAAYVGSAK